METITAPRPISPDEIVAALTALERWGNPVVTDYDLRRVYAARPGFHPALRGAFNEGHITIRRIRGANRRRVRWIALNRNSHHLPTGGSR